MNASARRARRPVFPDACFFFSAYSRVLIPARAAAALNTPLVPRRSIPSETCCIHFSATLRLPITACHGFRQHPFAFVQAIDRGAMNHAATLHRLRPVGGRGFGRRVRRQIRPASRRTSSWRLVDPLQFFLLHGRARFRSIRPNIAVGIERRFF